MLTIRDTQLQALGSNGRAPVQPCRFTHGTVVVTVRRADTRAAVPGVNVRLETGPTRGLASDGAGGARFRDVPAGPSQVSLELDDRLRRRFEAPVAPSVTVVGNAVTNVEVLLRPRPLRVTLTVSAPPSPTASLTVTVKDSGPASS